MGTSFKKDHEQEVLRRQYNDVFGLGATMYELAALRPAFPGKNMMNHLAAAKDLKQNKKKSLAPLPSFYSKELSDLLTKMLEHKNASRKYIHKIMKENPIIKDKLQEIFWNSPNE